MNDARYALRGFRRSPGFTLIAVLSLALGIGANTAIFSLLNAVVLRRLPVPDPDRLVVLTMVRPDGFGTKDISHWMYQQIRDRNRTLASFAAVAAPPSMTLLGRDGAEQIQGEMVSGNYFETLGVNAILGRVLTPDDDRVPDAHPVCVISYGLWQRRFASDPQILGRTIVLNRRAFTVVGVTPKEFFGTQPGASVDVRVPLMMFNTFAPGLVLNNPNGLGCCLGIGRLKVGATAAQAQAEIDSLYHHAIHEAPQLMRDADRYAAILQPGGAGFGGPRESFGRPLLLLMAVVGLVLLIACANVANLLMTRASARRGEIAMRLALGAGRARLVRQLLTESLILALGGAALGVALAWWTDRALLALAPRSGLGTQLALDVNPDWRVLLFALASAMAAGILFGLAPALRSTRADLAGSLRAGHAGGFAFSKMIVVALVALSLVLLIGAGLFLRSLRNLKSVAPGFHPEHLVMLTISPSLSGYTAAASWSLTDTILDRARDTPGVVAASWARISPLAGAGAIVNVTVPGYAGEPAVWLNGVGADYFRTLDTPLLAGRVFNGPDSTRDVAIVNEKATAQFWPHENPLGKHMIIGTHDCEIIGVVKDAKYESLRQDIPVTAYVPIRMNAPLNFTLHVRVAGDPAPVIAALTRESRQLDRSLPIYKVTTMDAQIDNSLALDRLMALLTSLFGLLAVVLAAVGLYGVMAYIVTARTREIGVRMALGASRATVLAHVIRESAALALIGVALGIPVALWASRGIASLLYGLNATDPATYAALAVLLLAIALAAAWIPARRASKVDPMVALRYE